MRTRRQAAKVDNMRSMSKTKKQLLEEKKNLSQLVNSLPKRGRKKLKKDQTPTKEVSEEQQTKREKAKEKNKRVSPLIQKNTSTERDKRKSSGKQNDRAKNRTDVSKDTRKSSETKKTTRAKKAQVKKIEDKKSEAKQSVGRPAKTAPSVDTKKSKSPAAKQNSPKVRKGVSIDKGQVKKIQFKGKIPIDDYFPMDKKNFHVLEHQGKIYSATLNQTSVQANSNKFYIIQVLQCDNNSNTCYFFTRWGRVGVPGQTSNMGPYPIQVAIMNFEAKKREKNVKGNYREIELNYGVDEAAEKQEKEKESKQTDASRPQSKLPKTVKGLIELIFDLNMMDKQMAQIGYNVKKMPLGKLSKENIMKGYKILEELLKQIQGKNVPEKIANLTNDFYSIIPHDFGFTRMSSHILNNEPIVKKKLEMLEALAQIKVATSFISTDDGFENRIDANYAKLQRQILPIDQNSKQFEIINRYLQTTHGSTHHQYTLELVDLFSLKDLREDIRYTKDIPNKMLLWHGSRLTNFVGILSQGLRIAPPEAPVTGYMFGKGVYFADMSSKSANYCFTSRENNTGILLLCEVALGETNGKFQSDYYASNLPPGKQSTKGVGKTAPNPANYIDMNGVTIPMGPGEFSSTVNTCLLYNQYIVYDVAQIKIRYLLRTKFNYTFNRY